MAATKEKTWVTLCDGTGKVRCTITSKPDREVYNLWDMTVTPPKKIGKANNPKDLDKYIKFYD